MKYLVRDFVPANGVTAITGHGRTESDQMGCTTLAPHLALELAACVAYGWNFQGLYRTTQRNVLYYTWELEPYYITMLSTLAEHYGTNPCGNLHSVNWDHALTPEVICSGVKKLLQVDDVGLLVIDPLLHSVSFAGGTDQEYAQARRCVLEQLATVCSDNKCAMIVTNRCTLARDFVTPCVSQLIRVGNGTASIVQPFGGSCRTRNIQLHCFDTVCA